jgi:hypothetical protein
MLFETLAFYKGIGGDCAIRLLGDPILLLEETIRLILGVSVN